MSEEPDKIWATPMCDDLPGGTFCEPVEGKPNGGQPNVDATPYIREDIHEAVMATNRELVAQIAKMHSDYAPVIDQVNAQVAAIKRESAQ